MLRTDSTDSPAVLTRSFSDNDPWLTLADAAKRAGNLHTTTLRRAIKAKGLTAVRINGGRVFRLRASWVDAWLEGRSVITG